MPTLLTRGCLPPKMMRSPGLRQAGRADGHPRHPCRATVRVPALAVGGLARVVVVVDVREASASPSRCRNRHARPDPQGTRRRRSGRLNVVEPSPPPQLDPDRIPEALVLRARAQSSVAQERPGRRPRHRRRGRGIPPAGVRAHPSRRPTRGGLVRPCTEERGSSKLRPLQEGDEPGLEGHRDRERVREEAGEQRPLVVGQRTIFTRAVSSSRASSPRGSHSHTTPLVWLRVRRQAVMRVTYEGTSCFTRKATPYGFFETGAGSASSPSCRAAGRRSGRSTRSGR